MFLNDENLRYSTYTVFNLLIAFLALTQNYLFLIALFTRLHGLFHHQSGPLSLSKCTPFLYIGALFLIPFLCLSIPISRGMGATILLQRLMVCVVAFCYFILLSTLLMDFTR